MSYTKVIDICMYGCRDCNFSCKYCMGPKKITEDFILNEKTLLEAINSITLPDDKIKFIVWGGEPLLHFDNLKKTILFLKSNFKKALISFSTNGYFLGHKHIQDFILNSNIIVQLSCDGIAQTFRSSFNPLEDDFISHFLAKLSHKNLLSINCIMHNQNPSINNNIKYFIEWMNKYNCLDSELSIRFTPINESDETPEFNFSGDNLNTFIHEYELLFIQLLFDSGNLSILHHFSANLKLINEKNLKICDFSHSSGCTMFATNLIKKSNHIDTKGIFISCNLIDSGIKPRGKIKKEQPSYCNDCKFKNCKGCFPCPASDYPQKCEFKKAWLNMTERILFIKNNIKA